MKRMLVGFLFVLQLAAGCNADEQALQKNTSSNSVLIPSAASNKTEPLSEDCSKVGSGLSPDSETPTFWEELRRDFEDTDKEGEKFRAESAKKLADSQRIVADLRSALRFRKDETQKGVTLVHDNTTPTVYQNGSFYVYLGDSGQYTWPRVVFESYAQKSLLIHTIIFDIDNETFSIDVKSDKFRSQTFRNTKTAAGKPMVNETVDMEMTPEIREILERVIKSKKTVMHLQGQHRNTRSIVTTAQKEAIDRVLRYYDAKVYVNIYGTRDDL